MTENTLLKNWNAPEQLRRQLCKTKKWGASINIIIRAIDSSKDIRTNEGESALLWLQSVLFERDALRTANLEAHPAPKSKEETPTGFTANVLGEIPSMPEEDRGSIVHPPPNDHYLNRGPNKPPAELRENGRTLAGARLRASNLAARLDEAKAEIRHQRDIIRYIVSGPRREEG